MFKNAKFPLLRQTRLSQKWESDKSDVMGGYYTARGTQICNPHLIWTGFDQGKGKYAPCLRQDQNWHLETQISVFLNGGKMGRIRTPRATGPYAQILQMDIFDRNIFVSLVPRWNFWHHLCILHCSRNTYVQTPSNLELIWSSYGQFSDCVTHSAYGLTAADKPQRIQENPATTLTVLTV